jgi:RNA polymerase sigma factor (sigma-70 family)
MRAAAGEPILCQLSKVAAAAAAGTPDGELLERFVSRGDEDAFTALVRRHAALVLGVCQRVLHDAHLAEDAFQATFLVLARRAARLRRCGTLAGWLHTVARRLALRARADAERRRRREGDVPPVPPRDPLSEVSGRELCMALDEELARLPDRFRLPLLLCCIEGKARDEAARQLGWTLNQVKDRLERGRDYLRRRLARRGVTLGSAALLASLSEPAARSAPGLAARMARAVFVAASAGGTEGISARAVALAAEAVPAAITVKAAVATGLLLMIGAGLLALRGEPAGGARSGQPSAPPAEEPGDVRSQGKAVADPRGDPLPDGAVARLGTVRFNHGDSLNALRFTPDGKTVVSQGRGLVRTWDAASGKQQAQLAIPTTSLDDQPVVAPDGKTLVLLGQEFAGDTLSVWDLARGKEVQSVRLPVRRNELSIYRRNALSPDGKLCVIHAPKEIVVFEVATAKELCRIPKVGSNVQAAVFAGSDRLVTADANGTLDVWDARTGKAVRQFQHGPPAVVLTASADGSRLATLEHHVQAIDRFLDQDVIRVWDLATGARMHTLTSRAKRWFTSVQFSPDGKLLIASSAGEAAWEVRAWDVATGRRLCELDGAGGNHLAVSPDGGRLVVGGDWGKFELWDLKAARRLSDPDSIHSASAMVFLSPAGDRAFTVGPASISTWDGTTGRRLDSFDVPTFPYVGMGRSHSPDGRYATTFAGDLDFSKAELIVWDVAARRRLFALRAPGGASEMRTAFWPDSSLLTVWHGGQKAGEKAVSLWEVKTGRKVRSLSARDVGWRKQLSITADGKTLLAAGPRVVGIDIADGKELFSWKPERLQGDAGDRDVAVGGAGVMDVEPWRAVAVSPDASTLAGILSTGFSRDRVEDRIVLYEAQTGKVLRRWSDSGLPSNGYEELAFSPDSRLLASSDGAVVHVWEVATGSKVRTFWGHRGEVRSLSFSANGRRLASASTDSTVVLWDLTLNAGPAAEPGDKEVAAWWADLAGADAGRAQAAAWRLAEAPASVPFLGQRLRPVTDAQMKEIRQRIHDLDSDTFSVRQKAFESLERLGLMAAPALREELKSDVSAEVRRRVGELLAQAAEKPPAGEPLRTLRALAALEHAGTTEARRLLRALADGAPGAWLTQEAKVALERLDRRLERSR